MIGKTLFVIIIAAVLILAAIVFIPIYPTDVTECSFGSWDVDVEVTMADGTTKSLSVTNTFASQILGIFHEGQEISSITYNLRAQATGSGYDFCELDLSDVSFRTIIKDWDNFPVHTGDIVYGPSSYTIDVNGDYETVFSLTVLVSEFESDLSAWGEGDYTFIFYTVNSGDVHFRGLPGGDWANTAVPGDVYIDIAQQESGGDGDGDGDGDGTYLIMVAVMPVPDYIWCDSPYGPTQPIYNDPRVDFERPPGTYTVKVHWIPPGVPEEKLAVKTVIVTDHDVGVIFNYYELCIIKSLTFTVDASTGTISSYYTDSTHYLGSH